MSKVWAVYYIVYNSGQECHELEEPLYYDDGAAKEALRQAEEGIMAGDLWSGIKSVYLKELQVV